MSRRIQEEAIHLWLASCICGQQVASLVPALVALVNVGVT